MLENDVPNTTHGVNKWAANIYSKWQAAWLNQKASDQQSNSAVDTSNIQDLDVNKCSMTAETLNFWLKSSSRKHAKKMANAIHPETLYGICSAIQRHLSDCNGVNAFSILDKKDKRCVK